MRHRLPGAPQHAQPATPRAASRSPGRSPSPAALPSRPTQSASALGPLDSILSPFRSEPHTLLGLGLVACYVLLAGWSTPSDDAAESAELLQRRLGLSPEQVVPEDAAALLQVRDTLWFAAVVFVGYCWLQLRDSCYTRPHPAFWRGVHGVFSHSTPFLQQDFASIIILQVS